MAAPSRPLGINSVFGPNAELRGEFEIPGSLRIDGVVRGTVRATGRIVIGKEARLACNIYGERVIVGGIVKGNIFASGGVVLLASSLVLGDIVTTHIEVENGTLVHGLILASGNEENWEGRLRRWEERRSLLSRLGSPALSHNSNG